MNRRTGEKRINYTFEGLLGYERHLPDVGTAV
jgi:hypothetical protein